MRHRLRLVMWLLGALGSACTKRAGRAIVQRSRAFCASSAEVLPTPLMRSGAGPAGDHPPRMQSVRNHILALCQANRGAEAAGAMRDLEARGTAVPTALYSNLLLACMDTPMAVTDVVDRLWSGDLAADEGLYSALVRVLAHWDQLGRAVRVLHRMRRMAMPMRRRTVMPVIDKLCRTGRPRAAARVWLRAEACGIALKDADFALILGACCRAGDLEHVPLLMARLRDRCADRLPGPVVESLRGSLAAATLQDGRRAFAVAEVDMDASSGFCPNCHTRLAQLRLTRAQRELVRQRLLDRAEAVDPSGALLRALVEFDQWLSAHASYDCVIDGPNVAYDDQNFVGGSFNYYQLEDMRQHAQLSGMHPLLIMPRKYMPRSFPTAKIPNHTLRQKQASTTLTVDELLVIEHWRELGVVFECDISGKDDWLWMYASLHGNGRLVVTNDEMRDHWAPLLDERLFRRWKDTQILHFGFEREASPDNWTVTLHFPEPCTHATQTAPTGEWHIASADGDRWLCVQPDASLARAFATVAGDGEPGAERETGPPVRNAQTLSADGLEPAAGMQPQEVAR